MDSSKRVFQIGAPRDEAFAAPTTCRGNACKDFAMRANYWPNSREIRSVSAHNSGSKSINVSIWWGTALGGCGTGSSEVIFPGETIEIFTPSRLILGYCTLTVSYTSKEEEDQWKTMGAQCHFNGSWYNDGETTCISDTDHKCRNGRWVRLGTREYCKG